MIFLFFILLSAEKKISSYNNWLSQRCAHYMWSHIIIILSRGVPITCGLILSSFSAEVCPLNVVSYYYHSQQRCVHYMWSHIIIILNSIPVLITALIIHPLTSLNKPNILCICRTNIQLFTKHYCSHRQRSCQGI